MVDSFHTLVRRSRNEKAGRGGAGHLPDAQRQHCRPWSPDSKWLAYSKVLPNDLSAIHLYSLADAKSTQVTDGMSDATNPVFDKNGKYLYFTASTNSGEASGSTSCRGSARDQFDLSGGAG